MAEYMKSAEAVARLSPEEYYVTQQSGTEAPFENAFWDQDEPGLYVDIVSGEPLFTSIDKFHSNEADGGSVVVRRQSSGACVR